MLAFRPLTPRRWDDFCELFGSSRGCSGCWCMWWRVPRARFHADVGAKNRAAMRKLVHAGIVPGILAYRGSEAVAWCAVAPREHFPVLDRSRALARVDDQPVWSITCFFVRRDLRRTGVTTRLIAAAVDYARAHGARIVEGYPVEPTADGLPDASAYTGLASVFRGAGFTEVARRSPRRAIYRNTGS